MKKIITLIALALTMGHGTYSQTIKIIKGGEVIATYPADMVDAVVFSPESTTAVQSIAGVYDLTLSVSLIEMPSMGVVATLPAAITVAAAGEDKINITFPACTYEMNGTPMALPSVEVTDIDVAWSDGVCSFSSPYSGVEESTSKEYGGTVTGTITIGGDVDITTTMKYGAMPFTLSMRYTNPAAE